MLSVQIRFGVEPALVSGSVDCARCWLNRLTLNVFVADVSHTFDD